MKRREFTYASLLKSMTIAVLTKWPCCSQTAFGDSPIRRVADGGETGHESGSVASRWVDAPDEGTI